MITANKTPPIEFKELLKAARARSGRTQAEVGFLAGISAAQYAFYEQGQRQPTVTNLAAICRAINVSADHLLQIEITKEPKP